MKIIGAGLGRTGTSSLKAALEMLGFGPCYHMQEITLHPEHIPIWLDAVEGNSVDWQDFFQPYQATLDWPACEYYPELMDIFPDAKVILTVREPEKWYASTYETIFTYNNSFPSWARAVAPQAARQVELQQRLVWQAKFGGKFEDRAHAIKIFQQHNATVQQTVPAARLLVYEITQGWVPLCQFLDVPIPAGEPFPHVNDKAEFQQLTKRHKQSVHLCKA